MWSFLRMYVRNPEKKIQNSLEKLKFLRKSTGLTYVWTAFIHRQTYTHINSCVHTYSHTYLNIFMDTHTYSFTRTSILTFIHTLVYTLTFIHRYMYKYVHACMYMQYMHYTQTHTYTQYVYVIHTHTHTLNHLATLVYVSSRFYFSGLSLTLARRRLTAGYGAIMSKKGGMNFRKRGVVIPTRKVPWSLRRMLSG